MHLDSRIYWAAAANHVVCDGCYSRQQTADSRQLTQDSLDRRGVVSATVGLPPVAGVEGLLDDVDTHLQVKHFTQS